MAVQASQSITLTDVATGGTFLLSTANIINFLASGVTTLVTYIDNRGSVISRLVVEPPFFIDAATGGRTQAVTQSSGVIYINSDRIIYMDDVDVHGAPAGETTITYDAGANAPTSLVVSELILGVGGLDLTAGNTFGVQILPSLIVRYLNNLRVNTIVSDGGTASFIAYDDNGTAFAKVYARNNPGVIQGFINAL